MRALWAIVCRGSSTDRDSNNISLFQVIEEIAAAARDIPESSEAQTRARLPIPCEFVVLWARTDADVPESALLGMRIRDAGTGAVLAQPPPIQTDLSGQERHRQTWRLDGIPLPEIATGTFRLLFEATVGPDAVPAASTPLLIRLSLAE